MDLDGVTSYTIDHSLPEDAKVVIRQTKGAVEKQKRL